MMGPPVARTAGAMALQMARQRSEATWRPSGDAPTPESGVGLTECPDPRQAGDGPAHAAGGYRRPDRVPRLAWRADARRGAHGGGPAGPHRARLAPRSGV